MNNQTTPMPAPGTGLLLYRDGTSRVIVPRNGRRFTFQELRPELDCELIEAHVLQDGPLRGALLLFDEEGRFVDDGRDVNPQASRLWLDAYPLAKYPLNNPGNLCGIVLLTHNDLLK